MSQADILFKENLKEIMAQEWEIDNRATWEDGSQVKTKRILQVVNKVDLSKDFPIQTLRPISLKLSADEIIWIFVLMSTNINDLSSNVWKAWADEHDTIKKSYAYQIAKPMMGYPNQVEYLLGEAEKNPTSRRLMMNMFDTEDTPDKPLFECAYATHFSIKNGKLHSTLIQRSGDFIPAAGFGGWNTVGYALLTHMIARHLKLEVGTFTHFVQDLHLYNKHQEFAEEMLKREPRPAPKLIIDESVTNFFDFRPEHFKLEGYDPHPQIKGIPIAV